MGVESLEHPRDDCDAYNGSHQNRKSVAKRNGQNEQPVRPTRRLPHVCGQRTIGAQERVWTRQRRAQLPPAGIRCPVKANVPITVPPLPSGSLRSGKDWSVMVPAIVSDWGSNVA